MDILPVSGFAGSTDGWGARVTPASSGDELPSAVPHVHVMAGAYHWPSSEHALPALLVMPLLANTSMHGSDLAQKNLAHRRHVVLASKL